MFGLFKKKPERPHVAAVIAAGGSSTRMKGGNKLLAEVAGMPVLAHTLRAFEANGNIDEIVIVAREDLLLDQQEAPLIWAVRRVLASRNSTENAMNSLLKSLQQTNSNQEFLIRAAKKWQGRQLEDVEL